MGQKKVIDYFDNISFVTKTVDEKIREIHLINSAFWESKHFILREMRTKNAHCVLNQAVSHPKVTLELLVKILENADRPYTKQRARKKILTEKPHLKGLPDEWVVEVLKTGNVK